MSDTCIIAHGMSELDLFSGIIAWTDCDPHVFSRNGGRNAIVMSHLPAILSERPFDSEKSLHNACPDFEYRPRGRPVMPDLGIFPVMDYDGDDANVRSYVTGNLLRDVPLAPYVTPVLNYPNLEAVMDEIGYDTGGIDKAEFYKGLVRGLRRRDDILRFYNLLRGCGHTNMDVAVYHILRDNPNFQSVIEPPAPKSWDFL